MPGTNITQVQHTKLSNNGPGEWTTALSVDNLASAAIDCTLLPVLLARPGGSDGVAIGRFAPVSGTFCITSEAVNLNSAGIDEHLMLSGDGLWAIFERPSGVWVASRAAVGNVFAPPVQVTGFPAPGGSYYPALGMVGSAMQCFYSDGTNAVMQPINLATAALTGGPAVVSRPARPGRVAISPTPVMGSDGDVEALLLAEVLVPKTPGNPFSGSTEMRWANDLDPATPTLLQIPANGWQCCGGIAGGYLNYSVHGPRIAFVMHAEVAILLGDNELLGGVANLDTSGVNPTAPNSLSAVYFVGAAVAPPVTLPGVGGQLGLNAAVVFQLGVSSTTSPNGTSGFSFRLPTNPALRGQRLPIQAVLVDFGPGDHYLHQHCLAARPLDVPRTAAVPHRVLPCHQARSARRTPERAYALGNTTPCRASRSMFGVQ